MNKSAKNELIIGKIGSSFGVQGWLKVHTYLESPTDMLNFSELKLTFANGKTQEVSIEAGQEHGKGMILKLQGVENPESAKLLTGATISIARDLLPPLQPHEFYWSDLIGLTVVNIEEKVLGKVTSLMATGSNDVLIVKGDKEFAVPYLMDEVILKVDLENQKIHVNWEPI